MSKSQPRSREVEWKHAVNHCGILSMFTYNYSVPAGLVSQSGVQGFGNETSLIETLDLQKAGPLFIVRLDCVCDGTAHYMLDYSMYYTFCVCPP